MRGSKAARLSFQRMQTIRNPSSLLMVLPSYMNLAEFPEHLPFSRHGNAIRERNIIDEKRQEQRRSCLCCHCPGHTLYF